MAVRIAIGVGGLYVADNICDRSYGTNLFAPCRKLRKVRLGIWEEFRGTELQKVLSSITSKHLSTLSLELAHPDWYTPGKSFTGGGGDWRTSYAISLTGVWQTTTRCWCWRLFGGGQTGMRAIVG